VDGLFVPIVHEMRFKSTSETKLLLHIGDLHFGHPGFCRSRWERFKEKYSGKKDIYCIGMGDYWDFSRWSDRKAMRRSGASESATKWMDAKVTEDVERSVKEFEGFTWIGMLEGNHDWEFSNGNTATQMLADLLGTRYLGTCCYIHHALYLHGGKTSISHVCHHGTTSSSRTVGGSVNALEHWSKAFTAHIYAMGHDHSSFVVPCTYTPLFGKVNNHTGEVEIVEHESWFVRSGSMLKGYIPNERSYIATKALPARRLTYPELRIGIQRTREDGVRRLKATIEGINPAS